MSSDETHLRCSRKGVRASFGKCSRNLWLRYGNRGVLEGMKSSLSARRSAGIRPRVAPQRTDYFEDEPEAVSRWLSHTALPLISPRIFHQQSFDNDVELTAELFADRLAAQMIAKLVSLIALMLGFWQLPAEAVREVIDNLGNTDQERVLESEYQEMAAALSTRWPGTARQRHRPQTRACSGDSGTPWTGSAPPRLCTVPMTATPPAVPWPDLWHQERPAR